MCLYSGFSNQHKHTTKSGVFIRPRDLQKAGKAKDLVRKRQKNIIKRFLDGSRGNGSHNPSSKRQMIIVLLEPLDYNSLVNAYLRIYINNMRFTLWAELSFG